MFSDGLITMGWASEHGRGALYLSQGWLWLFSVLRLVSQQGGKCHAVDEGGLKFRGAWLGLDELHSCLPGGGPSLWLVLGSVSRGSGKEERRFSVKYFIILSTWRRFKT